MKNEDFSSPSPGEGSHPATGHGGPGGPGGAAGDLPRTQGGLMAMMEMRMVMMVVIHHHHI